MNLSDSLPSHIGIKPGTTGLLIAFDNPSFNFNSKNIQYYYHTE